MTISHPEKPRSGSKVVLIGIPPGLTCGLPTEDQRSILEAVGKVVHLNDYDEDGRAELEFIDTEGTIHYIYTDPDYIRPAEPADS